MTVIEARKALAKPLRFGDAEQNEAIEMIALFDRAVASLSRNRELKPYICGDCNGDGLDADNLSHCEECNGEGRFFPEAPSLREMEDMDEGEIEWLVSLMYPPIGQIAA